MIKNCLNFSLKNIPVPSEPRYFKEIFHKTEGFLTRVRWSAFFYLKKNNSENNNDDDNDDDEDSISRETFGLNTAKSPPALKETAEF